MNILSYLQSRLIDVGSCIASLKTSENIEKLERTKFDSSHVSQIEAFIDEFDAQLPMLTMFILPSGGEFSARLHMARSICRRAERNIVAFDRQYGVCPNVLQFMNRLSDFLFVLARTAAKNSGIEEVVYKKPVVNT